MRQVLPELLDSLSSNDPAAMRSRSDLRLINRLMGNYRWICRTLEAQNMSSPQILELGAGDGTLAQCAWKRGKLTSRQWSAMDLAPRPSQWPADALWHQRDFIALRTLPDADIVVANLVLHHFREDQLASLGRKLPSSCRMLIACEPARRWVHSVQGRILSFLANLGAVTRHDMRLSIRGGFRGAELPQALGLVHWETRTSTTFLGAYRCVAWR